MTTRRKSPTMSDVARKASVSAMTVSRALESDSVISPETRSIILTAAEELGYVFHATASNLRSQKTDFVAVTLPSINNANFADTVSGLSEILSGRNMQTLLGYTNDDMDVKAEGKYRLRRRAAHRSRRYLTLHPRIPARLR